MNCENTKSLNIWNEFCTTYKVIDNSVELFKVDEESNVLTKKIGRNDTVRSVLERSESMEYLIRSNVAQLESDWGNELHKLDGLIYMIGHIDNNSFSPLYIGKTETIGKKDGNLSANIKNLDKDTSRFARWGDNYAYHIGDLSACVLPGHSEEKVTPKYQAWKKAIFKDLAENVRSDKPMLQKTVYFWTMAWSKENIGIWKDLGPVRLSFLEYMLIGVASISFPGLLNREGRARN